MKKSLTINDKVKCIQSERSVEGYSTENGRYLKILSNQLKSNLDRQRKIVVIGEREKSLKKKVVRESTVMSQNVFHHSLQ